jgi:hypothetical protein
MSYPLREMTRDEYRLTLYDNGTIKEVMCCGNCEWHTNGYSDRYKCVGFCLHQKVQTRNTDHCEHHTYDD